MSDHQTQTTGGIGFCGLLAITFIVLRLCNVITWPWVWVLSPIWLPVILALAFCFFLLIFFVIVQIIKK